eukprot:tig00000411_g521.t1
MHSDEASDRFFKELLANTSIGNRAREASYSIEGAQRADRDAILSVALNPETLGAKTAALTPADDPDAAIAAAVTLKQEQAKGCPMLDVTASVIAASKENDPAKLWRILSLEHAKAFAGDAQIVDVVNNTWSCIDGRSTKAILGTPGGTMSEFILALAAFQKKGFDVPNEDTMQALVDLYSAHYTIPYVRQFYMHTDALSVARIAEKLSVDAGQLGSWLSNPPARLRPALLEYSANPEYMGCGHIKNTIEEGVKGMPTYGIDSQRVIWAVRSFMRALWADTSRGAGRFVYESKKELLSFYVDLPGLPCSALTADGFNDIKANLAAKLLLDPARLLVSNVRCGLQERSRRTLFQTSRRARRGMLATSSAADGTWTVLTVNVLPPRRVEGSDQYPADTSTKDYGPVAPPSRFSLDAAADLKTYLSTVEAAAGPHPAALDHSKIAQLVARGKPRFIDTRFAPHYCIDGRHVRGSVHTPGGDISEFLLALSAFQRTVLKGAAISDEHVFQIMTIWIDTYAIPNERPFYMHTDERSDEYLMQKLGRDASFDAAMPPAHI